MELWDEKVVVIYPNAGAMGTMPASNQQQCIAFLMFTVGILAFRRLHLLTLTVLAAFGTIGGALFGFDVSSMSAWIGADQYLDYFDSPDSNLQGGITASMSAGSFAGAIAAGFISDKIGRRLSLMIASVVWIIGAVIQCSSHSIAQLVAGRVVSGLAGMLNPHTYRIEDR